MHPKVSVIIPTYNRSKFVYSAIKSVLNQTFEDFEIIVVDDASTDNTRKIVHKFDEKKVCYVRHKENKGGSAARNTGIKRSKGKIIAFLDDDDLWMRNKLEKQLNLINENLEIGVVYTDFWNINESGNITRGNIPSLKGNIFSNILKKNSVGTCSTVLLRKECFHRVGLFDENLPAYQDWDMWIRLARHYQFDYVDEPLVLYRVHEKRISTNLCARMQAARSVFKKFSTDLNNSINHKKTLGYWHYRFGKLYCECGDMGKGRREFIDAISKDPYSVIYSIGLLNSFFGLPIYNALYRLLGSVLPEYFKSKFT